MGVYKTDLNGNLYYTIGEPTWYELEQLKELNNGSE